MKLQLESSRRKRNGFKGNETATTQRFPIATAISHWPSFAFVSIAETATCHQYAELAQNHSE